jgi:hypothetical protein
MMQKVKPHEFFRLDFDQIVEEGKHQEEILRTNIGEHTLVRRMHEFFSNSVLPLIVTDDWVFESAHRFATEYVLDCIRLLRLTGVEVYQSQQKLALLKNEVTDLVARAKLAGYVDSFGSADLEKVSDFKKLLVIDRMPADWVAKVDALYDRAIDHEEIHVTVALRSIRDLYEIELPRVMYVVKRAIKVANSVPKKSLDDKLTGISEDITWYSKYIPIGHALHPVFGNLKGFYKIARNVGNHHKGFKWEPARNMVILEDKSDRIEVNVTEFLQKHRHLVHLCELGVRGILTGFCERERGNISNNLVIEYIKIFPPDWAGGEKGVVQFYGH